MPLQKGNYGNDSCVIAVVGPTGSGKSTFIKTITQREDIQIGHSLVSATKEVLPYKFIHNGRIFVLLDTPGFDDTYISDAEILRRIIRWLRSNHGKAKTLQGLMYFHRLNGPRMQGSNIQNLRLFRDLCGDGDLNNLFLTATFWESLSPDECQKKLAQLHRTPEFWGSFVEKGATTVFWANQRSHGLELIEAIANTGTVTFFGRQEIAKSRFLQMTIIAEIADRYNAYVSVRRMKKMVMQQSKLMEIERQQGLLEQAAATQNAQREQEVTEQRLKEQYAQEAAAVRLTESLARTQHEIEMEKIAQRVRLERERVEEERREHEKNLARLQSQQEREQQEVERLKLKEKEDMQRFYDGWTCTRRDLKEVKCDSCKKEFSGVYYHCCFCFTDNYDLCESCWLAKSTGTECLKSEHPSMTKKETSGCIIM